MTSNFNKSAIAVHHEQEQIIIHRNGRGFFGNVKTWSTFYNQNHEEEQQQQLPPSERSAISASAPQYNNAKTFSPTKSFALLQLVTHPYIWHLILPVTLLIIAISFISKNNNINDLHDINGSGSPIWTSSGVTALLLVFSFLTVTILPRLITPYLFSEPGHRSDSILPFEVKITNNYNNAATSSTLAVSFDDNHCAFRRVPLTPKSVGFFVAIMAHPISHFILLFTNAFVKESFYFREVSANNTYNASSSQDDNNTNVSYDHYYSSSTSSLSKEFSPFSFVASWFTFDFVRSTVNPMFIQEFPEAACGLGRFWYWLVVPLILLGFFGVILGIFWSPTQMQIEKQGGDFPYNGQWIWGWSLGLALFPIFFRVLFNGFSCYETASMFKYFFDKMDTNGTMSNATMIKSIPVSSLCPTCRCDVDASSSAGHTATVVISFIILVFVLPIALNLHTQLRRLSGIPYLRYHEKVTSLPRTDGLHLTVFILSRFLVPAFSGVLGNLISVGLVALFLDLFAVWFIWRSPNVSNVEVINFWFRRWTVPAAFSSSLLFCLWVGLVYENDPQQMRQDEALASRVKFISVLIQSCAFLLPVLAFILAYSSFKKNLRTKKNEENGTIEVLSNLHAMFHYREISAVSPSRKKSQKEQRQAGGAVGAAVQSSKSSSSPSASARSEGTEPVNNGNQYSPKNSSKNDDDEDENEFGHDSDEYEEDHHESNEDGEEIALPEGQQLVLQDEALSLALFPKGEDVSAETVLSEVARHVSFV